jgi:hypothetical protein
MDENKRKSGASGISPQARAPDVFLPQCDGNHKNSG